MITTITGANEWQRKRELDQLVAAFENEYGDMAIERLDGEGATVERMREALTSLPFLSPRKLVYLREPGKQKTFAEESASILATAADTTDVIIYEPKLDKRSSYYKTLKKDTDFREYTELDTVALSKWMVAYVRGQGGTLTAADARLLIDRVGTNQQLLESELTKLLHYNTTITRETIALLTERMPASTVFELLDAAFACKTKRALELYHEQRALRVEPQAILALMAWQLHILAVAKAGGDRSADSIAKEAKLSPYVVRKSQAITRKLTIGQIKTMIADLLMLDMQLKRSSIDADEAMQFYLLNLANR